MNQYFNFAKITQNTKGIVSIGMTIIIILLLSYSRTIAPLQTQLQNTLKQQAIIQAQIHNSQQQIQKLQPGQKQWENLEKNHLKQKTQNNPEQLTTATILKNIASAIAASQLTAIAIQPQTTANKQNQQFTPQTFNLSASGNYHQLLNFFLAIRNLNLLTTIPNFTIKQLVSDNNNNSNDNKLICNATLQIFALSHKKHHDKITYILNASRISGLTKIDPSSLEFPLGGEERAAGVYKYIHDCRERRSQQRGKPKCEGYIGNDPFSNRFTTASLPLTTWESKDLQFLGTIQQNNKTWAIISDPGGQLHYVTTGTFIGTNHNKITNITTNAIITANNQDNIYR